MGLFADEVNGPPAADRQGGAEAIERFADNGVVAMFERIGTGVPARRTDRGRNRALAPCRRPLAVPVLLVLAAVPIAWHVTRFGQVGLALFMAAVLLIVRARSVPLVAPAAAVRPTAT